MLEALMWAIWNLGPWLLALVIPIWGILELWDQLSSPLSNSYFLEFLLSWCWFMLWLAAAVYHIKTYAGG